MKKIVAVLCALLLLILAACDGGAKGPEKRIAGRWESTAGTTEFQTMEFVPGEDNQQRGQVNLCILSNEISGEYEIVPGEEQHHLSISYTLMMLPTTREFYFTIEEDVLVLQSENASEGVSYKRAAD